MEVDDDEILPYSYPDDNRSITEVSAEFPSTSEEHTLATLQTAPYVPQDLEGSIKKEDSDSESEHIVVKRTKEEEQVLTNKFLSGQLTFSEYAAQYGENLFEDALEEDIDEKPGEAGTSTSITDFEKNLSEIKESKTSKKKSYVGKKSSKIRNSLPPALKGLMGEANLRYARGDHETAIKMCFEIIRQFPWASEPFETLAALYELKGDNEKSLQVSLLAAHLNPRSSKHLWINLAEKSEERGDVKQAITCYGKAIRADGKDFELYVKQANLYEESGDKNSVLRCYLRLLRGVDSNHGEKLIDIAKQLAQNYYEQGKLPNAKEALHTVFEKCPDLITSELVNIMLEILMGLKEYKTCIDILVKFCNVKVLTKIVDDKFYLEYCNVPEDLVIDIFAKLVIISIHLHAFHLLDGFLGRMKTMDPETAGDFYFDIADAFIIEGKHAEALELLTLLTKTAKYNLPLIWLRMAECFKAMNMIEDAVNAYSVVVENAPHQPGPRLAVSELLISLGRRQQALQVLTQDEDSDILNTAMLYERCLLLMKMPKQKEQLIDVAQLFLSRHFVHIKNKEDLNALTTQRSDRKRLVLKENKNLQKTFSQGEEISGEFGRQSFYEPSVEEEWNLFWHVCKLCVELGKYDTLQRLAFSAQGSQKFTRYSPEIDLLCLSACYFNSDAYFGYNMVRALVVKNINCERSWNMFNMMILRADDSRHNRFLMRLLIRNPHHKALTILHANNCLVAGTYKYALSDYTAVYQRENSAMMAFLIGVTLCQMACQKFSAKKHSLVTQAVAYFWKYKELRGREGLQESHYNIGRAFHQLGLLPPAIHHYKKALEHQSKFIDDFSKHLNLQREAAFNLHLIYRSSGARDVARMYLEKYIVV